MFRSLFGGSVPVKQINPEQAHERLTAGAVIVDVREADEWRQGHIDGALHLPLSRIAELPQQVGRDEEVIVVCRSGNRSSVATGALMRGGYGNVSNLNGGMIAWQRRRLPVRR